VKPEPKPSFADAYLTAIRLYTQKHPTVTWADLADAIDRATDQSQIAAFLTHPEQRPARPTDPPDRRGRSAPARTGRP